ncbi:ATP-binding protein [Rhodoferax lacus]|nr:AAA family ATPase [Rhodoferax lacus]
MAVLEQAQLETTLTRALLLAQALAALEARQHMHGALSPQALDLLPDGSLRLLPAPPAGRSLSLEQLRYASPEQAGRHARVDGRSDLYSLGLILYEWLLGRAAFDSMDPLDLAYRQLLVLPDAPHTVNAAVPLQVSGLVMRLLAKSPDARYASAQGLADDLQHCLHTLTSSGQVPHFVLGQSDPHSQFAMPEQLYGRAREMTGLVHQWQCTVKGDFLLCLVSGEAGVGKTALVQALRNTVLGTGGMLVESRFDVQQRDIPSLALVEAFKTLLRQVLAGAQEDRVRWRNRLLKALGPKLSAVQELLPEMEWITGRMPPAPLLTGLAAQQRRNEAFTDMLAVFAGPEHPLLLFLDDVQWIDAASLTFVLSLVRERSIGHLHLVLACQDSAADASNNLARLRQEWQQGPPRFHEIRLAPLSGEEVAALIDDTCFHVNALPALSARVMQQTRGNPREARQFLQDQVLQGNLRYEHTAKCWRWTPCDAPEKPSLLWWT